jgi:hypothetical protein
MLKPLKYKALSTHLVIAPLIVGHFLHHPIAETGWNAAKR